MQSAQRERSHPDQGFRSRMTPCSRRQILKLYTLFKTQDPEDHTLLKYPPGGGGGRGHPIHSF